MTSQTGQGQRRWGEADRLGRCKVSMSGIKERPRSTDGLAWVLGCTFTETSMQEEDQFCTITGKIC